jgi:formylglycine-generating enzyme required for sulfatase activity
MNATTEFDVFVSYNTLDHAAVEHIGRALKDRGLTVFLDRWELVPGRPWPDALEGRLAQCRAAAVVLGPHGMGPWQQREHYLALDRQARAPAFSVIPLILPDADPALGFLSLNTWVDLRAGVDDAESLDLLAAAVRGEPPSALLERTRKAAAQVCPYRGLEVFREEDAAFFFGREAFVEELLAAVAAQSLVAVVGRSGSGKSSVVRAGLVPALRRRDANRVWEIATLLPGARPLHALASALLPFLEPEMTEVDRLREVNKLAEDLAAEDVGLDQVVERVLAKQPGTARLLLVVDQWEELYTQAKDDDARGRTTHFIDALLAAIDSAPVTVVLTLRADFYGDALGHRRLADTIPKAQVALGPMTRDELTQAVTEPAQKVGLTFEDGLPERLLDDVGDEPGNLPLMEFALKALWEGRRGDRLLHRVYQAMGGIKGAVAQRAESVYGRLDPARQRAAERLFTKLVRPGDETGDTRRRAGLDELDAAEAALVRDLAGKEARLLVTGRDQLAERETVEVAHEALIREWGRLGTWVNKVREARKDQLLMDDLAEQWKEQGKPRLSGLASGRTLKRFEQAGAASELAGEYLRASRARRRLGKFSAGLGALSLATLSGFLWWSDDLGLSLKEGAELLLHRAGLHHPGWIPEMVDIPAGRFLMGSAAADAPGADPMAQDGEHPRHEVTFQQGFRLGKYEVTFEQYCASTKRPCPDDRGWGRGDHPVIYASWKDANAYIDWLNRITGKTFRLPTEAEWEYAARGGTEEGRYWWCEAQEPHCELIPDVENCRACESTNGFDGLGRRTLPVGSFAANPFGLDDIAGNVLEWVEDCWHSSYEGAPNDGSAWQEGGGGDCGRRVVRGGSWYGTPVYLRSATRDRLLADSRDDTLGFRLAQDP